MIYEHSTLRVRLPVGTWMRVSFRAAGGSLRKLISGQLVRELAPSTVIFGMLRYVAIPLKTEDITQAIQHFMTYRDGEEYWQDKVPMRRGDPTSLDPVVHLILQREGPSLVHMYMQTNRKEEPVHVATVDVAP